MLEVVQPVHHDGKQTVPVLRRSLIPAFQCNHVPGTKRRELGVGGRSSPSQGTQVVRPIDEILLFSELQEDPASLSARRVTQPREQEMPSRLGIVSRVRSIRPFVNFIVLRSDECVSVADKLAKETGSLVRLNSLEIRSAVPVKECAKRPDRPLLGAGVDTVRELFDQCLRSPR